MASELEVVKLETLPRFSDKCILPPSFLQEAMASHEGLSYPMVYTLNEEILVGVREFTAPENAIVVPEEVWARLKSSSAKCILQPLLQKATSLRIRPLQFYPHVTNWKYYLESFLSTHYTTLSQGQTFGFHDKVAGVDVQLSVEAIDGEVVVDTDIALDVAPLNDIMAAQQLQQESALMKYEHIPEISSNITVALEPFNKGASPQIFKIDVLRYTEPISICISSQEDLFNVDLICSLDKLLNLENFLWSTMLQDSEIESENPKKMIVIDPKNDVFANARAKHDSQDELWLYLVPFAWEHNASVTIDLSRTLPRTLDNANAEKVENKDKIVCGNCKASIEKAKFTLHEAFCLRNNVRCSCGEVFPKAIPTTHWHCEICSDIHGESALFRFKHNKLVHQGPYTCDSCSEKTEYDTFVDLVQEHKADSCPSRLHECQFCHLIVPQGETTFEDRFQNLTHHENECGNKTIECYQCNKVLRNKELASHLRIHELVKLEKSAEIFPKCANVNCVNIAHNQENALALCGTCFGPLYMGVVDPNNMKLQTRIERKYVLQLTKGCGNLWCRNVECATGSIKLDFKQALDRVKGVLFPKIYTPSLPFNAGKSVSGNNVFWFCVNQSVQERKNLVDVLLKEAQYGENMIYKAVTTPSEQDARTWLAQNA